MFQSNTGFSKGPKHKVTMATQKQQIFLILLQLQKDKFVNFTAASP